jgi:hypothetical protein
MLNQLDVIFASLTPMALGMAGATLAITRQGNIVAALEQADEAPPPNADVDVLFHMAPQGVDVHLLTGRAFLFYASFFRLKPYPKEWETLSHWEWSKFAALLDRKKVPHARF